MTVTICRRSKSGSIRSQLRAVADGSVRRAQPVASRACRACRVPYSTSASVVNQTPPSEAHRDLRSEALACQRVLHAMQKLLRNLLRQTWTNHTGEGVHTELASPSGQGSKPREPANAAQTVSYVRTAPPPAAIAHPDRKLPGTIQRRLLALPRCCGQPAHTRTDRTNVADGRARA